MSRTLKLNLEINEETFRTAAEELGTTLSGRVIYQIVDDILYGDLTESKANWLECAFGIKVAGGEIVEGSA